MKISGIPVDASTLIYLAKADGVAAASACFAGLLVPPAVWVEVVDAGAQRGSRDVDRVRAAAETGLVNRHALPAPLLTRSRKLAARFGLGAGESEVLALGTVHGVVLLDEHRAARAGKALGITTIETIVVPALCVYARTLPRQAAIELMHEIARHTFVRAEMLLRVERLIEEAQP